MHILQQTKRKKQIRIQSLFSLVWLPKKVRGEEKGILLDERIFLAETQKTKFIPSFETKNSKVHEIQIFPPFSQQPIM
jgi:hypothetical protein